ARMRRGPAAAALIEQQDLIAFRIEQPPVSRRAAAAGAAMQEHRRLALRISAELPIHLVTVSGVQKTMGIGLYFRIHVGIPLLWKVERRAPQGRRAPLDYLRVKIRSQTPWPSRRPRVSNLVCGRKFGRGA